MTNKILSFLKNNGVGLKRGSLRLVFSDTLVPIGEKFQQDLQTATKEHFEHIGSTSVKGLKTKPILDFLLTYEGEDLSKDVIKALESIGFTYKGDILSTVNKTHVKQGRQFFALYDEEKTTDFAHIHALPKEDQEAKNLTLFRERLKEDPKKIDLYNSFKQKLLADNISREEYRVSKASVVSEILGSA